MSGAMNGVRRSAGKLAVIGVPYVWLLIFFLLPFLIIVKISVSEMGQSASTTSSPTRTACCR